MVEAHGADAAPASAEAVLARMRRGGEVPHLLGGFGPLVLAVLLALLVWAKHHENLARLLRGQETRIGARSRK